MIDVERLKETVDLVELVERDTGPLAGGVERYGPCPRCGGDDRFHLHTGEAWWFCRQCHPKRGDAIEYVRWRDGVGFVDACALLGGGDRQGDPRARSRPKPPPRPASETPTTSWQAKARAFVTWAAGKLDDDPTARQYLLDRGLKPETIRTAGLGFNAQELWRKGADWGLSSGQRVWLPRGWVIPCSTGGELWAVKIRRPDADLAQSDAKKRKAAKYIAITGSKKRGHVYGLDDAQGRFDVVVVEGELNCLVLRQALAGVCGVCSIGDAGNVDLERAAREVLALAPRAWALCDADPAGQRGEDALASLRLQRLTWPWGERDINDVYREGGDLAAWLVPQIGPQGEGRMAWARALTGELEQGEGFWDANPESDAPRAWRALLGIEQPKDEGMDV